MATHTIELAIEGGIVDATAPAGVSLSGGIFKRLFDAAQEERHRWQFQMPANYISTPVLVIVFAMATAAAGNVILIGRVKAVTANSEDIDTATFGANNSTTQAVPGTLGYTKLVRLTLANNDGLAADDWVQIEFAREGGAGGDTAVGDLELVGVTLEYSD